MFQALIEQARAMIQRLHASAEHGRDAVPEAVKLRLSELQAWDTSVQGIISLLFGPGAPALGRWRALIERRSALVGDAMRKDIKRGEYYGLIDYFHLAIGLLLEFEAAYRHQTASPPQAQVAAMAPPVAQLPPPDPERRIASEDLLDGRPPAARAVDGRWELTICVTGETYRWLSEAAVAREPGRDDDGGAAADLAATIVERVAQNTKRKQQYG